MYTGALVVLDASVLIVLAKIRRLDLVRLTYGGAAVGPFVFEEVVTAGRRIGALGVECVEQAIESGWLRVVRPVAEERRQTSQILRTSRLHEGEAQAIAIACRRKLLVALDDKEARSMAVALGLDIVGTAGLVLEARLRGHLELDDLEETLSHLSRTIWISPEVVAGILKIARKGRA